MRPHVGDPTARLVDDDARAARAQRLGATLAHAPAAPARIDIGLSSRSEPGAWSWPDGRIRVSRALIDLLDDDELRAALAHEMGHLIDATPGKRRPDALDGRRNDGSGSEVRADRIACTLLRDSGATPAALPRMLRKVAAALPDAADGPDPAALLARASAADTTCTVTR